MSKDYYNVLGVSKNATQDEVKKAFRKKAHEYHPDKKTGDEAKFKEANEAYQVLGDKQKRAQYDQFGTADFGAGGFGGGGFGGFSQGGVNINMDDLGDIFGDIFGGGRSRGGARARRGRDIKMILNLDFLDAVFGVEKEINLKKKITCTKCKGNGAEPGTPIETCKTCGGSGQVTKTQRSFLGNIQMQTTCADCRGEGKTITKKCSKCAGTGVHDEVVNFKTKIPAGIDDGETIRLQGHGEASAPGGTAGDLYLEIRIKNDKRFDRDGNDIRTTAKISFTQATLGDKIDIETVDGSLKLKIPAGTQPGTIFKLKDKGVPSLHGRGRGDQLVKVQVEVPKKLSRKQKKLLEDMDL